MSICLKCKNLAMVCSLKAHNDGYLGCKLLLMANITPDLIAVSNDELPNFLRERIKCDEMTSGWVADAIMTAPKQIITKNTTECQYFIRRESETEEDHS